LATIDYRDEELPRDVAAPKGSDDEVNIRVMRG
jgi:hypothetical protein